MKTDAFNTFDPISQILIHLPAKTSPAGPKMQASKQARLPQGAKIIGNYLLGRFIGEGSFGKVHLAMHIPTGEKVAIKIIDKAKMRAKDVSRVKKEIEIMKSVHHRHLITLYQIIETEKSLLLVTEYLSNGELFQLILKEKKIQEDDACNYFHQIIAAVEYLHRNRIAHRDLKPENILLDYDGQLKLIDFGLGSFYDHNLLKTFCGSPCYTSPEIIEGKQNYNPLFSDIWSCGVILFAMVCGHLPFCEKEIKLLIHKIANCKYQIPSHVSPQCKDLIQKILVAVPDRISIEGIKKHPWYVRNHPTPAYGVNLNEYLLLEPAVLAKVKNLGIDEQRLEKNITLKQKSKDLATYLITMKKLVRGGEKISTYIGGDSFNPKLIKKIKSDEKMHDQSDTEQMSHHVIEVPEPPEIPYLLQGKQASSHERQNWYSKDYYQDVKEMDEEELLTIANTILELFIPKDKVEQVSQNLTGYSCSPNSLQNMVMLKKGNQFYANNPLAKKKIWNFSEINKIRSGLSIPYLGLSLSTSISHNTVKITQKTKCSMNCRSTTKRQKTLAKQYTVKTRKESIDERLNRNNDQQQGSAFTKRRIQVNLPALRLKTDHNSKIPPRQNKRYKISNKVISSRFQANS